MVCMRGVRGRHDGVGEVCGRGPCKRRTRTQVVPRPLQACMHGTEACAGGGMVVLHGHEHAAQHHNRQRPHRRRGHHNPVRAGGFAERTLPWLDCGVIGGGVHVRGGVKMLSNCDTLTHHPVQPVPAVTRSG